MSASRDAIPADDERQAQIRANQGLMELLESWANPTADERREQRETWEYLRKAVDEDRPVGSKLYE